jgi:anti-sigma regulatory factor (Ser/Thr protein kinase)
MSSSLDGQRGGAQVVGEESLVRLSGTGRLADDLYLLVGGLATPPTGIDGIWPLRDFVELGALPGAVSCARLHARQLMWEPVLTRLSESAELLVSELVTNAMHASRAMERITPVRLWLLADKTRVLILVWDASPREPARMNISEDTESGRGLLLVEAISDRWDWYFPQDTGGKVVWALLEMR